MSVETTKYTQQLTGVPRCPKIAGLWMLIPKNVEVSEVMGVPQLTSSIKNEDFPL